MPLDIVSLFIVGITFGVMIVFLLSCTTVPNGAPPQYGRSSRPIAAVAHGTPTP